VSTTGRPHDLLFAPSGEIWVSDWATGVSIYSGEGERLGQVLPSVQVHHLAFTPDGRVAWLTDHADFRVYVLATGTREVLASRVIGGAPHHVAVTADGSWALVANHDDGTLVVFDTRTRRPVSEIRVGAGPHGVWAVP
jgi:serine/threonine-protein kinase